MCPPTGVVGAIPCHCPGGLQQAMHNKGARALPLGLLLPSAYTLSTTACGRLGAHSSACSRRTRQGPAPAPVHVRLVGAVHR
jgi:hypothetical protein